MERERLQDFLAGQRGQNEREWAENLLGTRRRIRDANEGQGGEYRVRIVCSKRGIDQFVSSGIIDDDWIWRRTKNPIREEVRIEVLETFVEHLKRHRNYEFAICTEDQEGFNPAAFFLVKNGVVLLETFHGHEPKELDLQIDEPHIAAAFRWTFGDYWQKIKCRGAASVHYLERCLIALRKRKRGARNVTARPSAKQRGSDQNRERQPAQP